MSITRKVIEKRFCDRCHKEMPLHPDNYNYIDHLEWNENYIGKYGSGGSSGGPFELCESCFSEFKKWWGEK